MSSSEVVDGGNAEKDSTKDIFGSDSESDEEVTPPETKNSTKDIFGSDSDSDEEVVPAETTGKTTDSIAMKSIFGDDSGSDNDNEIDNEETTEPIEKTPNENNMDFMYEEGENSTSASKQAATHAKICISGTDKISDQSSTFSLRLPNFLKMQTNPHNKQLHHEESEASVFQGATSMIRWRYKQNINGDVELDEKGLPVRESNARLVKWSDGSYQLLVGQEVFDSSTFPVADSYLYTQRKSAPPDPSDPAAEKVGEEERSEIKTDTCLECVGAATERIVLRPSSVASAAHARHSLAIAAKYSRKTKIKDREYDSVIIPNAEKDTDARAAAINEDLRRERRRRAQMASSSQGGVSYSKPAMSSRFMEEEDGFDSTSLRDIKKGKKFKSRAKYNSEDEDEDMEDDMEDEDDDGFIVNDDELEDEDEVDEESYEDGDNDDEVPKRGKSSNGKMSSKKDAASDSDQDDFETVKPKKRIQESSDDASKDVDMPTQKKRRRAIVDSDDDE